MNYLKVILVFIGLLIFVPPVAKTATQDGYLVQKNYKLKTNIENAFGAATVWLVEEWGPNAIIYSDPANKTIKSKGVGYLLCPWTPNLRDCEEGYNFIGFSISIDINENSCNIKFYDIYKHVRSSKPESTFYISSKLSFEDKNASRNASKLFETLSESFKTSCGGNFIVN